MVCSDRICSDRRPAGNDSPKRTWEKLQSSDWQASDFTPFLEVGLTPELPLLVLHCPRLLRHPLVTNIAAFHRSSVGRKMIVAVTGVILILFVIGHLLGNLQIFLGPEWINGYAEHLRELGPLLWIIRGIPARRRHPPHLLHDPARDREPPGAARALPTQGHRQSHPGLTHHGLERDHPARLHHLSPPPFHVRATDPRFLTLCRSIRSIITTSIR